MSETFTLKNFKTGLSSKVEEWLLAQDAATMLSDGFMYQGVLQKREGLTPFADGGKGSYPEAESRLVTRKETDVTGTALTGAGAGPYTATLITPVKPGSVVADDGGGPVQTVTDDGDGTLSGDGTGTINYSTGALSVTFTGAAGGSVTADYTWYGEALSGAGPYIATLSTDVQRGSVDVTDDTPQIGSDNGAGSIIGTGVDSGSVDYYTGDLTVTFNSAIAGTVRADYSFHDGNPVMGIYMWRDEDRVRKLLAWSTTRINVLNSTTNVFDDITNTAFTGDEQDFFTFASYQAQATNPRLLFSNGVDSLQYYDPVDSQNVRDYTFTLSGVTTLAARHIDTWQDRLLLFRTIEDGVEYPYRIRLTAPNQDDFDTDGSDRIDLEGNAGITAAPRIGENYIIFTDRRRIFRLSYTSNDAVPAVINSIPSVVPVDAMYSSASYKQLGMGIGKEGIVVSDGLNVELADIEIPNFTKEDINHTDFSLVYGGDIPSNKQHIWLYPSADATYSDRALIYNYEERNWSTYKVPITVVGQSEERFGITWNTLTETSWSELAANYATWRDFQNVNDEPVTLAGTQKGHIYRAFRDSTADYKLKVRGITTGTSTVIDTDVHLVQVGDKVGFQSVAGTTELNGVTANVTAIADNSITIDYPTSNAWTSGGVIYRAIPFEYITKPFNPYIEQQESCALTKLKIYTDISEGHTLFIDFRTDDSKENAVAVWNSANPWPLNLSRIDNKRGNKKFTTIYPGIRGNFVQIRIRNEDPFSTIRIHAIQMTFESAGNL